VAIMYSSLISIMSGTALTRGAMRQVLSHGLGGCPPGGLAGLRHRAPPTVSSANSLISALPRTCANGSTRSSDINPHALPKASRERPTFGLPCSDPRRAPRARHEPLSWWCAPRVSGG
jgi:hypothetical protein